MKRKVSFQSEERESSKLLPKIGFIIISDIEFCLSISFFRPSVGLRVSTCLSSRPEWNVVRKRDENYIFNSYSRLKIELSSEIFGGLHSNGIGLI